MLHKQPTSAVVNISVKSYIMLVMQLMRSGMRRKGEEVKALNPVPVMMMINPKPNPVPIPVSDELLSLEL